MKILTTGLTVVYIFKKFNYIIRNYY